MSLRPNSIPRITMTILSLTNHVKTCLSKSNTSLFISFAVFQCLGANSICPLSLLFYYLPLKETKWNSSQFKFSLQGCLWESYNSFRVLVSVTCGCGFNIEEVFYVQILEVIYPVLLLIRLSNYRRGLPIQVVPVNWGLTIRPRCSRCPQVFDLR